MAALDREEEDTYTLTITASDGGMCNTTSFYYILPPLTLSNFFLPPPPSSFPLSLPQVHLLVLPPLVLLYQSKTSMKLRPCSLHRHIRIILTRIRPP